jgi:hypothetical protein
MLSEQPEYATKAEFSSFVTAEPIVTEKSSPKTVEEDTDYLDPVEMLKYDSAGVAINATGDTQLLDRLGQFAGAVKHYAEMMKQNAIAPSEPTIKELGSPLGKRPTDDDFINPVTLLHYDPAGLAMRTRGDAKLLNELINFSCSLTYYVGLVQEREAALGLKIQEETDYEEGDNENTLQCPNVGPCFLGRLSRPKLSAVIPP